MAKVLQAVSCSHCMDSITLVKGGPLARIACANCRQAVADPRKPTEARDGLQLKCALAALTDGEPIDMQDLRILSNAREKRQGPECDCDVVDTRPKRRQSKNRKS